jgi:hypothetical protein
LPIAWRTGLRGGDGLTASRPQSVTRETWRVPGASEFSIGRPPLFLNLFLVCADENSVENGKHPWRPLGQMLVERGLIDEEQLENALREHARTGEPIGAVIVELGYVAEPTLRNVLLEQCGLDLTRQEGFGSGLLGELERRRGAALRTAAREPEAAPEPPAPVAPAPTPEPLVVVATPAPEPIAVAAVAVEVHPEPADEALNGVFRRQRENVSTSVDALLETFEERSRALSAELAAMRRLLHEIAG